MKAQARRLAVYECWRRGDLYYLLHPTQRQIYDAIQAGVGTGKLRHFLSCSRRLGKSYMLVVMALEIALRKPQARILYLAPFGNDARKIVQDTLDQIFPDCPEEFRPSFKTQDQEFHFKNGSTIRFRGTNGERAQYLRGGAADLVVLDECGTMDNLDEIVNSVVTPMTLTTGGLVIMATTPSMTPAHESKSLCDQAARDGCLYEFNILFAHKLTPEAKVRALKTYGETDEDIPKILAGQMAPKTTRALREYWCKWVTDAGSAVVPEFTEAAKAKVVQEWPRPPFYDAYTGMDPGHVDNTGIVFGYWDIRASKLVIEDEFLARHLGTDEIAAAVAKTENRLWGQRKPFLRVSDVEHRLVHDLAKQHGLPFSLVKGKNRHEDIWALRQMVANGSLIINPRCANLIRQLETATWDRKGKDFADEVVEIDGEKQLPAHFDLVAALKYLIRMLNKTHNPYPAHWDDPGPGKHRSRVPKIFKTIRTDTPLGKKLDRAGR